MNTYDYMQWGKKVSDYTRKVFRYFLTQLYLRFNAKTDESKS